MEIKSIFDSSFEKYGKVLTEYDVTEILEVLDQQTPTPEGDADTMIYVPSADIFEKLPIWDEIRYSEYGGVPIEIGYCCGKVDHLNALEYHCNTEIVITGNDQVIIVGSLQDIKDYQYDTSKCEAFFTPKGTAWKLYQTTLHYAPFTMEKGQVFKHACGLIAGTNFPKPDFTAKTAEDRLMAAQNSWKICHADSPEAAGGGFVGLVGKNISREDVFGK